MSAQHLRHVGNRQKCLLFGWWSWQTQILTLPVKWYCDNISKSPIFKLQLGRRWGNPVMIIWSQRNSLRVSQNQKFNLWDLYPNTRSKATSQVFTLSHLCCLELMSIVPAQSLSVSSLPTTIFSQICRTDCYSFFFDDNLKWACWCWYHLELLFLL